MNIDINEHMWLFIATAVNCAIGLMRFVQECRREKVERTLLEMYQRHQAEGYV